MQISSARTAGQWPLTASRSLCWRVLRSWRCARCAQAALNMHRDWGMPLPHLHNWARPCSAGQGSGADLRVCFLLNVACRCMLSIACCMLHGACRLRTGDHKWAAGRTGLGCMARGRGRDGTVVFVADEVCARTTYSMGVHCIARRCTALQQCVATEYTLL